jgi:hypothetical protein
MSKVSLINEAPVSPGRTSPPRTWAGTLVNATERAHRYLHLMAVPCGKCNGPVVAGWIGTRKDDITQETDITGMGAICILCGSRPEALIDRSQACHFRPVEWEWMAENKPSALEPTGDPLPAELSQDADRPTPETPALRPIVTSQSSPARLSLMNDIKARGKNC